MHKPLMILFSLFPAILGLSLAFIIMKPQERMDAMAMLPVTLAGIVITQYIGIRLQRKDRWSGSHELIKGTQIGGLLVGIITFVMVLFLLK